ncbi:hypothetical protein ANN_26595 [Periplaneta americana]|uniref:Uncharacterized protein n=1 Tax=Periplaneta americana TaxID=6978 RepID=A0ABQ8RYP2_PERAM|nr:hypothetical protein ANN_26595 [Periplaneta americana]
MNSSLSARNILNEDAAVTIALCSLLFEIALLTMNFNLVQEEVINNIKSVVKRLSRRRGLKISVHIKDAAVSKPLCSLYLLFGTALLAMSFNLVKRKVVNNIKFIAKKLGIVKDDEEKENWKSSSDIRL